VTAASPASRGSPSLRLRPGRIGPVDLVRLGGRGLRARRLRTGLTALGIGIGIAAMLAVLGISSSSRAALLAQLDRLGTNLLTVTPGQTFFGEDATLPDTATPMIRRIGPVEGAAATEALDAAVRRTDLIPKAETGGLSVIAADLELLDTLRAEVATGRWLDAATARYPTVVLGAIAAQRLGMTQLDEPTQVWIGGRWFAVIGILEPLPLTPEIDRSVIVGREAAAMYLEATGEASTVYLRADPASIDDVRRVIPSTANPEHPDEVQVSRPSEALEAQAAADDAFTGLLLGLGAVALIVGGLGIANVMLMAVLERRTEIGLRRALGATRGHFAGQFLTEAVLLAFAGGVLGILGGTAIAVGYASSQHWLVDVPLPALVAGLGVAVAVGAVAGLYPALRASSVPPTDALRSA
jgi:putative ABC transport system permease protein